MTSKTPDPFAVPRDGEGVREDLSEAVEWFRKAAELGDAKSMCSLGFAYYNGQGIAADPAEAVKWYLKSAAAGNATAMFNLSVAYADGRGVAKDSTKAIEWCRRAARLGEPHAQAWLKEKNMGTNTGTNQYGDGASFARGQGGRVECRFHH